MVDINGDPVEPLLPPSISTTYTLPPSFPPSFSPSLSTNHTYLGRAGTPVHTLDAPTHPVVAIEQVYVNVSVAIDARVGHLDGVLTVIELQVLGGVDELDIRGVGPGECREEGEGGDEETHGLFSVCRGERGGGEERGSVCGCV